MIQNTPTLESNRLILRKFTAEDTEALFQILKDKEVNAFLPWFPLETINEAQDFLQNNFMLAYKLPNAYHYAICLQTDNIPIGYINISDNNSHDLGYGLRKDFWHMGIATEACNLLLSHLKATALQYITATHDILNPHSGDVMKKIGMVYRYSYKEVVLPKNIPVTFRMYQLNFKEKNDFVYKEYWNKYPNHFIEKNV